MEHRFIIRMIHGLIWMGIAYKWSDWRNYRKYYPTMLFMGAGNLVYNLVFYNKRLWDLKNDFLAFPFHEILIIFIIFFPSILVFLSNYPENTSLFKQIKYLLMWAIIYTTIELIMFQLDMIDYQNGWNMYWSILHNIYQFPLLYIHHKNPLLAWALALGILGIILHFFTVPFLA